MRKILRSLTRKFGDFTEGNSEGFREQAKETKILAENFGFLTEGNEGNEDSVQATEQRPLHSLPRAAIEGAAQNVNAVFSM